MVKVKNSIKKELDCQPAYNKKYPKAKIKFYDRKTNTNFCNHKIPKEGSQFICLSVILINSVFRAGKNCYPQVPLEKCIYVVKQKHIPKNITDDKEISSDSDREDSDEGNYDEVSSNEAI